MPDRYPVFDLDGTLLDSDEALLAPFLALGVRREDIGFGRRYDLECERHGIDPAAYVGAYDTGAAQPFPGVHELVTSLDRFAICSNKETSSGTAELRRLGWRPDLAMFADEFPGPKELGPVLARLGLAGEHVVFVGDTGHDRECARAVGATFALAAWNPRAIAEEGDVVLTTPAELLSWLAGSRRGSSRG